MERLLISAIAVYAILFTVTYIITFQRLMKVALQYPTFESRPINDVPNYLREVFQQPISFVETLGFKLACYIHMEELTSFDMPKSWAALLYEKASKTFAKIEIRHACDPANLFDIEFLTFFKDRSLLLTMNGKAHGVLGEIPNTTIQDPYSVNLEDQWQAHQDKLHALTVTKTACGLSPDGFLKALQAHYKIYIDSLLKFHQISPVSGTDRFQFSWRSALQLIVRMSKGKGKFAALQKQRQQIAKASPALQVDIPPEIELDRFRRMQQMEQGRVKRKFGLWVLLGSLALFVASFAMFFDAHTLIILIGVLFLHELGHFLAMKLFRYQGTSMFSYLRSCTSLNKGLPKEQKAERKGVRKIIGRLWKPSLNTPKG